MQLKGLAADHWARDKSGLAGWVAWAQEKTGFTGEDTP